MDKTGLWKGKSWGCQKEVLFYFVFLTSIHDVQQLLQIINLECFATLKAEKILYDSGIISPFGQDRLGGKERVWGQKKNIVFWTSIHTTYIRDYFEVLCQDSTVTPLNFARDLISLILQVMKIGKIKYPQKLIFYIDSNNKTFRFVKLSTC